MSHNMPVTFSFPHNPGLQWWSVWWHRPSTFGTFTLMTRRSSFRLPSCPDQRGNPFCLDEVFSDAYEHITGPPLSSSVSFSNSGIGLITPCFIGGNQYHSHETLSNNCKNTSKLKFQKSKKKERKKERKKRKEKE